jgi:hypothetical protein
MSKPRKNANNRRKQKPNANRPRNNNRSGGTQEVGDSRRMPPTSGLSDRRPRYNPTWNPQWLKVARTFQYSSPAADFGGGFGKVQDLAVGSSATVLIYNSAALSFAISDIPSVTEFGTLFDQYRIAGVKLDFEYISGSEAVISTTTSTNLESTMLMYEDNDDGTAPPATNAGWQAVYESGRALKRVFPGRNNKLSYMLKPKYLTADVDTSATTTGRSLGAGWVDGATGLDVLWRGLKVIVQANPVTTTYVHTWRITATYFTEWRNRQ